jgi:DNA-binding Xre family transcriptional regulator
MKFAAKEIAKYQTLEELENEVFTEKEREDIRNRAEKRANIRNQMSESISKSVSAYMAREKIGFNELTRRLEMSSATSAKILRGDANITLDTLAAVSVLLGLTPQITLE